MTDLTPLFSSEVPLRSFSYSTLDHIPAFGSIVYTVFLDESEFIYVGIAGVNGKALKERNPRSRINSHSSGRRSGDQFCIYIQDFYVIPEIIGKSYEPKRGQLDQLTRDFIQTRLTYRYLAVQSEDSDKIVRQLEKELQSNQHGYGVPKLNGVSK